MRRLVNVRVNDTVNSQSMQDSRVVQRSGFTTLRKLNPHKDLSLHRLQTP